MVRSRLKTVLITTTVCLSLAPVVAYAFDLVFDEAAVAKALEQLKELKAQTAVLKENLDLAKQQISFLTEMRDSANSTLKAIGEIASITINIPNMDKISKQIQKDAACLIPDGVNWGINIKEFDYGSICNASSKYREALFFSPLKDGKEPTVAEANAERKQIKERRQALFSDTVTRSLAHTDIALKQAEEAGKTADQLSREASAAQTVQERAAVQAQIDLLQARTLASQNQILAQMLKLQATIALEAGISTDVVGKILENDEDKK